MIYRAVGNRCAVCIDDLGLKMDPDEALRILRELGFKVLDVDIAGIGRALVGEKTFELRATMREAPAKLNCSGFTKWLYAQKGIWIPRWVIQQHEAGESVELQDARLGDLIFRRGRIWSASRGSDDEGVGHVGLVTEKATVLHATYARRGVSETSVEQFLDQKAFRGVRRIVPTDRNVITLEVPDNVDVEISDDLRWIILRHLQ